MKVHKIFFSWISTSLYSFELRNKRILLTSLNGIGIKVNFEKVLGLQNALIKDIHESKKSPTETYIIWKTEIYFHLSFSNNPVIFKEYVNWFRKSHLKSIILGLIEVVLLCNNLVI